MKNLLLLVFSFCFLTTWAQDSASENGFKHGLFVASEYQEKTGLLFYGQEFDLGYRLGYCLVNRFDKGILKLEVSAADKGGKFNLNGVEAIVKEIHLDCSVNAQFNIKNIFNVGGGGFVLKAVNQEQDKGEILRNVKNQTGQDLGVIGIIGKNFKRFIVEVRYRKGLIDTSLNNKELKTNDLGVYFFVTL